jgi:predicted dehydrogenase
MVITGEFGTISWNEEKKTIKLTTNIWNNERFNYEPKIKMFRIKSNPLRNELEEFVNSVKNNTQPYTDVNNAITVAKNLDLLAERLT